MADELTIKVSAKLDEGSVSAIQSQLDGIGKSKKDGIRLKINSDEIKGHISEVRKDLEAIESHTWAIKFQVDPGVQNEINNIQKQLTQLGKISKATKNTNNSQSRTTNRKSGGSSKKLEQSAGFPVSRRKWAQKYKDVANAEEQQIIQSLLGKGNTLVSASGRQRYDKTGKETGSSWIVTYRDELGKTVRTMMDYNKTADKWRVTGTAVNANYEAQAKAQEKVQNYLTQQENSYKNLNSLAFNQKGALDKDSAYGKAAIDAIEKYNDEIKKVQGDNSLYGKDSRKRIEDARQEAQRVIKEQKALRDEERKQEAQDAKLEADQVKRRENKQKEYDRIAEQGRKEEERRDKEARDYERKENEKAQKEQDALVRKQQQEQIKAQKERERNSSMYAGMFDQITKEEQRASDYNSKFLSGQDIGIKDLESKAFNQNNPLTGDFKKTADQAVAYWRAKVEEAKGYSEKLTQEQENQIKQAEAAAKRTVIEQQKSQWRGEKLAAKDVDTKVSNANWGLDIQVEELKQAGQYTEEMQTKIENLRNSLSQVKDQKGFEEWNKQLQQFNQELELAGEKAKTAFKNESMQLDIENLQTRLNNLKNKYDEFVEANPSKANSGIEESFQRISDAINSIDMNNIDPQKLALLRKEVRNFGADVNGIVTPAQSLSQILTQNLGGVGQYLARFTSAFYIINKGISTIKSMVNEVTELDTSLMELQKVTTLSGDSLVQFTDNAYKTGKEVGRTGKDVIDAVTTFSRAGYNLEESNELAKAALTMTNVGVDIPNTEAAASDMISILRAYDKQANESMQVIDELYNVANKEPLDFGNITDMLVTAGGTLAQSNTSLEETMGLLTAGFATLRDNSVANG